MATQVIIIGGGLAGMSAAHTVIQHGGNVVLIDKMPFCGGNSTKATSGINGAGTRTQRALKIADTPEIFEQDTANSAKEGVNPPLVKVLTHTSAAAVEWLMDSFDLDLSLVSRLGGHSFPRTHRGKERFPGMTITYALMEKLEEIAAADPSKARIINKAKVTKLIQQNGKVVGVEYEHDGQAKREDGLVVVCTGGFGADFSQNSLLQQYSQEWRGLSAWKGISNIPDLMSLPTTNGDHCTGDGIKLATEVGAKLKDMEAIQVHPTGLVHPDEPDAKLKFLAAEALRGVGGILIDRHGRRFCDDLGKRDYVTGKMWQNEGPFRLILNSKASAEIEWHIKHYIGRGLMKAFKSGKDLAREMGIPPSALTETFQKYNGYAQNKNDPWGKKFFHNLPLDINDSFNVAIVTPVVHYTMGGLDIDANSQVLSGNGPIPGLYCAGEVMGGVHGKNRLGGNSLLDCVAFGRVAGRSAAKELLSDAAIALRSGASGRMAVLGGHAAGVQVRIDSATGDVHINVGGSGSGTVAAQPAASSAAAAPATSAAPAAAEPAAQPAAASGPQEYTLDDVAKHSTDKDCWVVVNGQVLNVTEFLDEHPGGKKAIMLYAGKDASEEFNMLHKPDVVKKYAPDSIIGNLKASAKL